MLRKIIAVLAGIISGFLTIELIENLFQHYAPIQAEIITKNTQFPDAQEWIDAFPLDRYLYILIAYLTGSFIAGFITTLLSPQKSLAFPTGFVLLIGGFINLMLLPHPIWFILVSLSIYLPLAYLGGTLGMKLFRKS